MYAFEFHNFFGLLETKNSLNQGIQPTVPANHSAVPPNIPKSMKTLLKLKQNLIWLHQRPKKT